MSRTIKNCFFKNLTFEKLLNAHLRARDQKTSKKELILFEMNLENNIVNLLNQLKTGRYRIGKYRTFYVTEPKLRKIQALPYVDRIVHQWYVEEFIKPYIVPKFIKDTFACIVGRGTHKAVETIQHYMQIYQRNVGSYWILKCDIRKYFYSINPQILFNILKRQISDKKLLDFTYHLINDRREEPLGIPIGNYTSQFFANIYLNELDQYIKHILKVKYYVRYMDDFILLLPDKNTCKEYKAKIEAFLKENLELELNHKSRYYPCNQGVNFCGFRIWPTHRLLRKHCKTKIKRHVNKWNKLWNEGKLDFTIAMPSLQSWMGHAGHCNSYNFKTKILKKSEFIYDEQKDYGIALSDIGYDENFKSYIASEEEIKQQELSNF